MSPGCGKETLPAALKWRPQDRMSGTTRLNGVPTWSWLSVNKPISMHTLLGNEQCHTIIKDIDMRGTTQLFDLISEGSIFATGPLFAVSQSSAPHRVILPSLSQLGVSEFSITWDQVLPGEGTISSVFFLLISTSSTEHSLCIEGLVLQPTYKKRGEFTRVGIATSWRDPKSFQGMFEQFLEAGKDKDSISSDLCMEFDTATGFGIEIV